MTDRELDQLRGQIAETDREILSLVNARLGLVRAIRARKDALGVPFLDPQQEGRLLERLREANAGPLSAEGVERLFRTILDLAKTGSAGELGREGARAPD
jgi:chorismate mutase/prephenate dehydratase